MVFGISGPHKGGKADGSSAADATALKATAVTVMLMAAGFLGNYFAVPLFFGADFLFGSIAVLLILYFRGFGWGMSSAIIIHSYTYFLWGHPYGFISFVSEALFVGLFLRKAPRSILILDGLFWLLVGMPLNWLYYDVVLHMGATTASFIVLKQAINGVFNALLATLMISYLPLDRFLNRSGHVSTITLQESIFNLFVVMVLFPSLLITMLQVRHEKESLETEVLAELQSRSADLRMHLSTWHQVQLNALQELSALAGRSSMTHSAELQHETQILKRSFPDFHSMHVENAEGRTIAFSPQINEKGESTLGLDFSDRAWFQKLKAEQRPVLSEVFLARAAVFSPVINLCVPVFREDLWLGAATGTLNLGSVRKILQSHVSNKVPSLILTDSQGRIIAGTAPEQAPMKSWDRKTTGVSQPIDDLTYLWHPGDRKLPSMARWRHSFYVRETSLEPALPWKLAAEATMAPLQHTLYTIYVKNLTVMACLTTIALLLSHIFSRGLTRPLAKLAQVTADLPERLAGSGNIDWPSSSTREVDSLIGNFGAMAMALETNFREIQVQDDQLRQANRELQREVRERRQAEEALQESEGQLRQIIDLVPHMIFVKDWDGKYLLVNQAVAESYSTSVSALTGKHHSDFHPDENQLQHILQDDREVMTKGEPKFIAEEAFTDSRGNLHFLQTTKVPFHTISNNTRAVLGVAIDISERKQAEEERLRLQAALQQAQKAESLGRMAGSTAHHFNNLLGVVTGNLELALYDLHQDSTIRTFVSEALKASLRATEISRLMLTYLGQTVGNRKAVDLSQIAKDELLHLRASVSEKIRLIEDLQSAGPVIMADVAYVKQILNSLVVNACEAIGDRAGDVTVAIQLTDVTEIQRSRFFPSDWEPKATSYACLSVSDTGCGLDTETRERMFDPFFSTKFTGRGLGLSVALGLLRTEEGAITVESRPGQGSCFRALFPLLAQDEAPLLKEVGTLIPGQAASRMLVLLVDDDPMIRYVTQALLEHQLGCETITAADGSEAVEIFRARKNEISLVLLDVSMPGINGWETLKALRALRSDVPVVLTSGYGEAQMTQENFPEQPQAFLGKPYTIAELKSVIVGVTNLHA